MQGCGTGLAESGILPQFQALQYTMSNKKQYEQQ